MKMATKSTVKLSVVIPSWNGLEELPACVDSLLKQSLQPRIIIVENGSKDGSLEYIQQHYPQVELIINKYNQGFAGGVNAGIRKSIADGDEFVALFNNDAVADSHWLEELVKDLTVNDDAGIATCKLMTLDKSQLDSTGDQYTTWGLPYPRGRGEPVSDKYDDRVQIFAGSGGASLYRISMLKEIGLFDEDFFAYYEDVDISFRAQLAGWKVRYVPEALAYHQIGATSGKIKGFTTYQGVKNMPWVLWKNAPLSVLLRVLPRFMVAYYAFLVTATWRNQGGAAVRGYLRMWWLLPKKTVQRWRIQHRRKVPASYIWAIMTPGLPPNARRLQLLFHPIKALRRK